MLTVTVKGQFVPTEYDTLSGKIRPVEYVHKNGNTVITYSFVPCNSILLKLSDKAEAETYENTPLTLVPAETATFPMRLRQSDTSTKR